MFGPKIPAFCYENLKIILGITRSFFKLEKSINMEKKALIISYPTAYSKLLWLLPFWHNQRSCDPSEFFKEMTYKYQLQKTLEYAGKERFIYEFLNVLGC
jgi:hypothetical protein